MHRRRLAFENASTTILVGRDLLPKAGDLIAEALGRSTDVRSFVGVDPGSDELVEVTPNSIRLRKKILNKGKRDSARKSNKNMEV